jgi:hypothetical protein
MTPNPDRLRGESRRTFLKKTTAMAGAAAAAGWVPISAQAKSRAVNIVPDPDEPLTKLAPVRWAIEQLAKALTVRGIEVAVKADLDEAASAGECVLATSCRSRLGRQILEGARLTGPTVPEAMGLLRGRAGGRSVLLACGTDVRGLVYALLEIADRVRHAPDPWSALAKAAPIIQQPANQIRSIARLFASEVEDKGWFNDRAFWERYLTELVTQRFNRFSLTLGLGYDFPTDIRDAYFHFAYPFLIAPAGYDVRALPLPAGERERNLEMLRFISEATAACGLHFQLGLWTHAYKWVNSPRANYVIEGLSAETHGPYCRDALEALLRACPAISGVTFRIHGESGIAEGSYEFWKTVFDGVARCGRRVEIDMHAKGMDEKMIELALATGMPVNISPKFWAEHMGLGYMQGAIRPLEMPPRGEVDKGFFANSSGARRFLRYGYGDLLREDRRYGILHRIWPGTQRLLLWGDPELAADYGRASSFCGSAGVEWCEPLSFKGRKGSGLPGGRDGYADASLRPDGGDFEKYRYSYRVWGRRIYDPDCDADGWRRHLRQSIGRGSDELELALAKASRILPLFTTAHCPSAANNNYWPEMYTNMAIVDPKRPHPYSDTLSPKRFGAVSSLDPEFFSRIDDFAGELLAGEPSGRYSPVWVAGWLEDCAAGAAAALAGATAKSRNSPNAELRRAAADIAIQAGLGHFFAWKIRAALLFALYERTKYRPALEQARAAYGKARAAWASFAEGAKDVYRHDVTFGPGDFQRGHWLDRIGAIDADIADMEKLWKGVPDNADVTDSARLDTIKRALSAASATRLEPSPFLPPGFHQPAKSFRRGEALHIEASAGARKAALHAIRLRFRRLNQAEIWMEKDMAAEAGVYRAVIPAEYADSPFPIQYHFQVREHSGAVWLWPGLRPGWQGQPYFVLRQA